MTKEQLEEKYLNELHSRLDSYYDKERELMATEGSRLKRHPILALSHMSDERQLEELRAVLSKTSKLPSTVRRFILVLWEYCVNIVIQDELKKQESESASQAESSSSESHQAE